MMARDQSRASTRRRPDLDIALILSAALIVLYFAVALGRLGDEIKERVDHATQQIGDACQLKSPPELAE